MTYVLTGDRGDIGSQIAEQISASGYDVASYEQLSEMPGNGILVHMAAKHPVHSVTSQVQSNIDYLQEVIDFAKPKARLFVFFSSTSVYGRDADGILTESSPIRAADAYASTKVIGEELVRSSGMNYLIIRCPAILETVNSYNFLSKLADKLMRNEPIEIFNADRVFNNFIDSDALTHFILDSVEKGKFNKTINAAIRPKVSLMAIVQHIAKHLDSASTIININKNAPLCQLDCNAFWESECDETKAVLDIINVWLNRRLSS